MWNFFLNLWGAFRRAEAETLRPDDAGMPPHLRDRLR
jgi:hypothetical protein